MSSKWNLKLDIKEPKQSAKDKLFDLTTKMMKFVNAPETIDLKLYKYNIPHKLAEEICKLTEERACEILLELKKELDAWK
jgi:hypothetical protein